MLAVAMLALFGSVILVPFFVQDVLTQSALVVGLLLLPGSLLMGFAGPFVGRFYDRLGPRPLVVPGAILLAVALWGQYAIISDHTPIWLLLAGNILMSLGLALLFTPLFTASLGVLPPHLYSHGSAIIGTAQQVAGAAGTAMFIALYTIGGQQGLDNGLSSTAALVQGTQWAFLAGAIVSLIVVGIGFLIPAHPASTASREADVPTAP